MAISAEELKAILKQQQQQFEAAQIRLIETLTRKLNFQPESSQSGMKQVSSVDMITNSIQEFVYDPENNSTFDAWFQRHEDIFRVELANAEDEWKVRLLLRKLGTSEHVRYTNFILPKHSRELTFEETVHQLSSIFGEQASLFNNRFQCMQLVKKPGDDLVTHAGIVNKECEKFKIKSITEDQFKCLIFACSLKSPSDAQSRTRILAKLDHDPDITLQSITTECLQLINLKHDAAMIEQQSSSKSDPFTAVNSIKSKPKTNCWNCGDLHFFKYCPFKQHECQQCHKRGHKETHCRQRKNHKRFPYTRFPVRFNKPKETFKRTIVRTTHGQIPAAKRKYIRVTVNGTPIRLQLDTASDITIIDKKLWCIIGKPKISSTEQVAKNASGGPVSLVGEFNAECALGDSSDIGTIYLSKHEHLNLLGLDWIEKLNLLDVPINHLCNRVQVPAITQTTQSQGDAIITKHQEVFQEGLGKCTKLQAKLHLKDGAIPVFRPKRPVPYAALQAVDRELERLVQLGVIKAVNYSQWATPIVVVQKPNGKVRVCADFSTGLNSALNIHQYPLPLPDDIFAKLNGGKCFAKIDLSDAYLQVEVDEASRELLTINTHRGLYQYQRLPFGVKTAPAIFQQIMDAMLSGISGSVAYLDDIIIMGASAPELRDRLNRVLNRISEYGFRLQADKCTFFMDAVKYLGFIIDKDGRRPGSSQHQCHQRYAATTR